MSILLSGIEFAEAKKEALKEQVKKLKQSGVYPSLTVLQVGHDPASSVYVKQKIKYGSDIGVCVYHEEVDSDVTTEQLCELVGNINNPIIVQLPLPKHIDTRQVLDSVKQKLDVDGFTTENMGMLMTGQDGLQPCTPKGVIELLEFYGVDFEGRHAVVVGRSDIVGKPMSMMLLNKNCTVTICHSKTKNLKDMTAQADLLVVAMGQLEFITAEHVKDGAVVVDVGIHRKADGKLCGDVKFAEVEPKTSAITPVPKGVGRCTVAILFANVVDSYLK